MLQSLNTLMHRQFSGASIAGIFILTQVVYLAILFYSVPKVHQHADGMKILDLLPTGYSPEYAYRLLSTLGEVGRSIYLWQQIPLDMIYPGLFAISFSLVLAMIFKYIFAAGSKIQVVSIMPIFAGGFDYLENVGIIIMLNSYPDFNQWIAYMTNIFSVAKSIATTLTFVILIIGLLILLLRRLKLGSTS